MRFYATTVLIALLSLPAVGENFIDPPSHLAVNEVALGDLATPDNLSRLGADCSPAPGTGFERICTGFTTLSGAAVRTSVNVNVANQIIAIRISFDPVFFDQLEAAMVSKFGKPTNRGSQPVQNAFGAKVTAIEDDWTYHDAEASIVKYCPNVDRGCITVETARYAAYVKESLHPKDGAKF